MISRVPDRIKDNIPKSVAIVGVGGIGSWTAMLFSQIKGVKRIGLFDEDLIEESNLERTWFKLQDLNTKKSIAMKDQIKARRTDINVLAYDHLTEENKNLLNLYDLKIVCADKRSVRQMVLECKNSISTGYDIDEEKDWISVSETMLWSLSGGDEDDEYTIEPSWGVPAMMGALITVHSVITGKRPITVSSKIDDFYKTVKDSNSKRTFSLYGDHEFDIENNDEIRQRYLFPFDEIKNTYEYYDYEIIEFVEEKLDEVHCQCCDKVEYLEYYPEYDEVYCEWCDDCWSIDDFKTHLQDQAIIPKFLTIECPSCEKETLIKRTVNGEDMIGCTSCKKVMNDNGEMEEQIINFPFEQLKSEYELLGLEYDEIVDEKLDNIPCTDCDDKTLSMNIRHHEDEEIVEIGCTNCGTVIDLDVFINELIEVGLIKDYVDEVCPECGKKTMIKQTIMNKDVLGCMNCENVEIKEENLTTEGNPWELDE